MVALTVTVGKAKPGETAPRRKATLREAALERPPDVKATTVFDFVEECLKRSKTQKAMSWREFRNSYVETRQVTKIVDGKEKTVDKDWTFYEYSPYHSISGADLMTLVRDYGRGLVKLGFKRNQQDRFHIYASTSHKWMQTFLAALSQNIPIVTAYDTLGEDGLIHSLVETDLAGIFTDNSLLALLVKPLIKVKTVRYIIHCDKIDPQDKRSEGSYYADAQKAKEAILEVRPDVKFISYEECIELGKEDASIDVIQSKKEDVSCIMYTSGSTGLPKGVVISNENVVAAVAGITAIVGRDIVDKKDRLIAFLPLAHILEMVVELCTFWWGSCLGYASVKTLTETSCKNCQSDLVEFKPTIMVGVAAVWESVRKGVLAKVKEQPYIAQKLFWSAYKTKVALNNYNIPGGSLFDVIFKKIRAATGGHLRFTFNGGSPISKDAQVFISNLIAPMILGYGLTETCANTAVLDPHHLTYGEVGSLTGALTAKLIDVVDSGYYAKNNQGEILLKGKCIMKEYFKNEKETSEAFTEDGWFKTGDIGEWTSNGALKVIDRKKNLVKTLNGEYIALEKLESVYRSNPIVLNLMVYADVSQVKPIAVVLPTDAHLKTYLAESKVYSKSELASKSLGQLCTDKKVIKAAHQFLVSTGKEQGLRGIELLHNVVLLDEEWTPQNGFVTSAQKLQRRKILESCKDQVEAAYK